MKFVFKHLGPIHNAELELGDLTILAGRNNTGKTYMAYTLYGFLKLWRHGSEFWRIIHSLTEESLLPDFREKKTRLKTFIEEGQVKWRVDRETLHSQQKSIMQKVSQSFSKEELANMFSASDEDFESASIGVVVKDQFSDHTSKTLELSHGDELTITYSGGEICISRNEPLKKLPSSSAIGFSLTYLYLSFLFPEILSLSPLILSAERFSISLFYKELDFTKNRLVEMLQENRKKDFPLSRVMIDRVASRYALPIRDNIDYTRNIPELQKRRSKLYDSKLFEDIKDMLGGYYRSSDDDIRFISKARKKRRFDIPLHIASSSARGLSDLYFFLRHVAEKNQLLIIDEPESHLDTANQIQFARLLARAVHAGLKVLITTHSDYIVKEINNLLMLSRDFKDKPEVLKKYGYSEHDFLNPASVRAYVAENNSLTRCTVDPFGIDMPVFDITIDAINRVTRELEIRLTHEEEE